MTKPLQDKIRKILENLWGGSHKVKTEFKNYKQAEIDKAETALSNLIAKERRLAPYNYTRLKPLREKLKITQVDMAVVLGVSRMTYWTWEKDEGHMPMGKYFKAVEFLERLESLNKKEEKS